MWDTGQDEVVEPFRVTPGFIAFIAAFFIPVVLGAVIVLGAWVVSDEVYAAEAASESRFENSPTLNGEQEQVEGWKKSLVGICPLH
jgi:glycerol uptake facilitator-like aquaporin